MKKYYAAENSYGSPSSMGFCNTWYVLAFIGRQERDDWVSSRNTLSAQSIKKSEVIKFVKHWDDSRNCHYAPKPFTAQYWGIVPLFVRDIDGCIGVINIVNPEEYYQDEPERFYG